MRIAARHGARNARIFGSVARGESDEQSDVDFPVTFDRSATLMAHAHMLLELEQLLGRPVDVAPEDAQRPRVRERVLREAVPL